MNHFRNLSQKMASGKLPLGQITKEFCVSSVWLAVSSSQDKQSFVNLSQRKQGKGEDNLLKSCG